MLFEVLLATARSKSWSLSQSPNVTSPGSVPVLTSWAGPKVPFPLLVNKDMLFESLLEMAKSIDPSQFKSVATISELLIPPVG